MKKFFFAWICLLTAVSVSSAQDIGTLRRDTLQIARDTAAAEEVEKLTYTDLMDYIGTSVRTSDSVSLAMRKGVENNRGRNSSVMGYRLRIYFDNSQNARTISAAIVDTFSYYYPKIAVYRTYVNPYFKVTVGDFRTKSDAMRFLEAVKPKYPTVFLVREPISTI